MSIHAEILASFCGVHRDWTRDELAAAKTLEQQHGWTPARAAFVATWIDGNPEGKFWRDALTAKGGICKVLRSVVQIEEKSGANAQVPHLPGWQAYQAHEDPAGPEPAKIIELTFQQKVAATQQPWWDLIEEGKALGKNGVGLMRWVLAERERRTGLPAKPAAELLRGQGIGKAL